MVEKVDKQAPAGALLPLSMPEKKKMKNQARAADVLPAVREVIQWTLVHAGIVAASFALGTACFALVTAYTLVITCISHCHSQPPSCLAPEPVEMTDAEEDAAGVLVTLWCVCVVSQAAAGALALRLRRHRLLLAYAALVATAAGHWTWARLIRMFVAAAPVGLNFWTGVTTAAIFMSGVGDVICFLGLVLRGGEE